jgi:hypothetical protein
MHQNLTTVNAEVQIPAPPMTALELLHWKIRDRANTHSVFGECLTITLDGGKRDGDKYRLTALWAGGVEIEFVGHRTYTATEMDAVAWLRVLETEVGL